MKFDLNQKLDTYFYSAFDTETSGAYPLGADIVEAGLVKWKDQEVISEFAGLYKPSVPMSDFIIGIHGITNEMVQDRPPFSAEVKQVYDFISDSVLVAHHAPFDLGFLVLEIEKAGLGLLQTPVLCTSLLARHWIPESENHKLQTLVRFLNLPAGTAHRALDDAKACMAVAKECFQRAGPGVTLAELIASQGKDLLWERYTLLADNKSPLREVKEAIAQKKELEIIYDGGNLRGKPRRIVPIGVVRNPDGDYVMAVCQMDKIQKRFYLNRIKDQSVVY